MAVGIVVVAVEVNGGVVVVGTLYKLVNFAANTIRIHCSLGIGGQR